MKQRHADEPEAVDAPHEASGEADSARLPLMNAAVRPEGLPQMDEQALEAEARGGGRMLSQGTLVIVVAVLIGAGVLLTMRRTSQDTGPKSLGQEVEAKIEQALAKLASAQAMPSDDPLLKRNMTSLFQNTESILGIFRDNVGGKQVPLEYVQKNPFARPEMVKLSDGPPGAATDRQIQARRKELEGELGELQLQTVMQGRVPVAVINGQLVQLGQVVGSFSVREIRNLSVMLECDGMQFTLSMQMKSKEGPAEGATQVKLQRNRISHQGN